MRATGMRIELTRCNTKQYESDKISVDISFDDGDDFYACKNAVKEAILKDAGPAINCGSLMSELVETTAVKTSIEKPKAAVTQKAKKEEPPVSEVKAPTSSAVEMPTGEVRVEIDKAEKKKTPIKGKNTAYDRKMDTHKKLLKGFLDVNFPGWNNATNLPKAGKASEGLSGTDFLDGEGEIIQSFKDSFLSYLRA